MPVIGVLALQGDVREHIRAVEESGARAVGVRRLPEIEAVDGLVIPGGESTTLWRLTVAFDLLEPVRKLLGEGMPAFGSCAGMIMLADRITDGAEGQETFGGIDMTVRRNAFGRQADSFERTVSFDSVLSGALPGAGPSPLRAVFIRAPWVEAVGQEVSVLASDGGRIVAVRQGALLATAFHPELTPDRRVHGLFVSMVKGTK
ncbi:MAG TPA: pyridoxal 5'-phosphate synthase glutaminase subunit PdxT [Trebonia sp.]|nr:pyridoxal 5'-phosphate synthase glutaminase subunit PdxT [Trebonia sp.]